MKYLLSQTIFTVDDITLQGEKVIEIKKSQSIRLTVKRFIKKHVIDSLLFLFFTAIILVVPQIVLKLLSRERLFGFLNRLSTRLIDIIVSFVGLLLASPMLLVVPILIKLDSPGPILYKQLRTGVERRKKERRVAGLGMGLERRQIDRRIDDLHGQPFYIYKFRTMYDKAERKSGPVWACQDDPRITYIGRWLRKFHIDEIPQFWNVLKGDMSLVGPRPERPEIINDLLKEIPEYQKRLEIRPGITGPAQIFLGYDSCMDDIRRKIQFDMIYISKQSLRMQILILVLTAVKIITNATLNNVDFFNLNLTAREDNGRAKKVIRIRTIFPVLLIIYFCGTVGIYAQNKNTSEKVITIKTNPISAVIHLSGEYQFIGRTPFVLPYAVYGEYKLKVKKLGYETLNTEMTFGGDTNNVISYYLKPKTPFKAFYRSLIFPGWGQYYAGRKFMGTVLMGATAGAIFALAHSENRYQDAQNEYEIALTRFNHQGSSFEEQQDAFNQLQASSQTLKDRENTRNTNLYIVGGVWLLNVLESVLFFPNHANKIQVYQGISMNVAPIQDGVALSMDFSIN